MNRIIIMKTLLARTIHTQHSLDCVDMRVVTGKLLTERLTEEELAAFCINALLCVHHPLMHGRAQSQPVRPPCPSGECECECESVSVCECVFNACAHLSPQALI